MIMIYRNLETELRDMGLSESQAIEVMLWTETLPISIMDLSFIKAEINWGHIKITPNYEALNKDRGNCNSFWN